MLCIISYVICIFKKIQIIIYIRGNRDGVSNTSNPDKSRLVEEVQGRFTSSKSFSELMCSDCLQEDESPVIIKLHFTNCNRYLT